MLRSAVIVVRVFKLFVSRTCQNRHKFFKGLSSNPVSKSFRRTWRNPEKKSYQMLFSAKHWLWQLLDMTVVEPVVNNRVGRSVPSTQSTQSARISQDWAWSVKTPRNGKDWICNGRLMELKYLQTTFLRTLPSEIVYWAGRLKSGDFSWQTRAGPRLG